MTHLTKTLLLAAVLFGLFLGAEARPVTMETAQEIASRFMKTGDLPLVATYRTSDNAPALFVFNTVDGFVIVSADDCETPIIGYSHEGSFDPDNVPVQLESYLQDFVARIQYGIKNRLDADAFTASQWERVRYTGKLGDGTSSKAVLPLLTSQWHQGCLYNSLCPTMQGPCGHAEVGCLAVAMGQIMHYWGYPATGWGSHSYSNAGVALSANFGETEYQWDLMPDRLTDQSSQAEIDAVATLLYHCGVAVNMSYTPSESTATFNDAMIRYFNYSRYLREERRSEHSEAEWISMLKECLDQKQPILYIGFGSGGHAFVCDGYDDSNLFHFNWGWGGAADGYYSIGNLNPNGYQFNDNNYAILGIVPQSEPCHVSATIIPADAGTIEGTGNYHYGAQCTLTAVPAEDYSFFAWRRQGGLVFSRDPSITFEVTSDISNIEAHFTCYAISRITASEVDNDNVSGLPCVSLEWSSNTEWACLKQFEINGEAGGIATDNEHIYIAYLPQNYPPFAFEKYTMDGSLVESFNVDGLYGAFCLAFDGSYYYCNRLIDDPHFQYWQYYPVLYRVDLENKTLIDSTWFYDFSSLTYDSEYDGFWIDYYPKVRLVNRQGVFIKGSPSLSDIPRGTAYYTALDGTTHLLLLMESGIFDFDIHKFEVYDQPVLDISVENYGACTGKYEDKDALFFVMGNTLQIFEINKSFGITAQIVHYRIYRTDHEGNTVMLADEASGGSYLDTTWSDAPDGTYQYGISLVFADGSESEILWSNALEKIDNGVQEDSSVSEKVVKKIIENGHLYLLVNGKKYDVTGKEVSH